MWRRNILNQCTILFSLTALIIGGCSSEDSPTDPGGGGGPEGPFVWYVDLDAMGTGDGKSWDNAFTHPADAMAAASAEDQIWVAYGTYYGPGDKTVPVVAFKAGVALYGGFGGGETDLSQRDMADRATFDGGDSLYHVVTGADNALLHGIVVRNGNAVKEGIASNERGGGIYCEEAKMRISNCIVEYNEAGLGGGISAYGDTITVDSCTIENNHANDNESNGTGGGGINIFTAWALIDHCTIRDNTSDRNGGGMLVYQGKVVVTDTEFSGNSLASSIADGGGVLINNYLSSDPGIVTSEFIGCRFFDNTGGYGGAVRTTESNPFFSDCEFENNHAGMIGAALYGYNSSFEMEHCTIEGNDVTAVSAYQQHGTPVPRIFNCIFIDNGDSGSDGGALRIDSVDAEIECCTIVGNTARNGGGIISTGACSPVVTNCILWSNTASMGNSQIHDASGASTGVTYCDIDQAGYDGAGLFNLRSDPLFVTGPRGDYYLSQTAAGQGSNSPCIDVGSDTAISLLLDTMTTRIDNALDADQVDLGFHYEPDN
jgi:hypothetical protein